MKQNNEQKPETMGKSGDSDPSKEVTLEEYTILVKGHLRDGERNEAYSVVKDALRKYPHHPLIVSYFGYLTAIAERDYMGGIEICRRSIALLGKAKLLDDEKLNAELYLNLGRTYLAAEQKPEAMDAFKRGLKHDGKNSGLRRELADLGIRKKEPLSFFARSNPINRYLGVILHRSTKKPKGKV
jgi:tetratricopeptide (TPR) repeat protein